MTAGFEEWDDEEDFRFDRRRTSSRRPEFQQRRTSQFLDVGNAGPGLFRTRSTGSRPVPTINIYNDQIQDSHSRTSSPYGRPPPVAPQPVWQQPQPQQIPVPVPQYLPYPVVQADNRGRSPGRGRWDRDELVEDIAELAIRDRMGRSRSRGRSDLTDSTEFMRWQREQKEREIEEATRRQIWEKDNELKQIKADAKRRADAAEAKDEQERWQREYEDKKRAEADRAKAEAIRIKEKIEREEREEKEEKERIKEQIKRDEIAAKEKREREREEFRREEKEKKEKEEAEKKARKEEMETEMRRRLANVGYTQRDIDKIVDDENAKNRKSTTTTTTTTTLQTFDSRLRNPTYIKIDRKYLEIDTLRYYDIPFEVDRSNPSFFIILREMDKYETDVLFEHTKRLRSGKLLIEGAAKDEKKYAFYRKRDRSTSRVRKVGILEFK